MQRNWFQAHLAGEKNYLVGINEITSDKRSVKELLLYDVEKIPEAVLKAAEEHKFEVSLLEIVCNILLIFSII